MYVYIYDSQREKTFLKYFGLMPSSVICTKLFLPRLFSKPSKLKYLIN